MTRTLVLDKVACTRILSKLARTPGGDADMLYMRLTGAWGFKPQRKRVSLEATPRDIAVLRSVGVRASTLDPSVLQSGWLVTYRHPKKRKAEVTVRTKTKPSKRRTFKTSHGKLRLEAVSVQRISLKEANNHMATKTKKRKADEELDELEGLEDLEDLEDLDDEDLDDDEPDDEDEDDEEDEEPAPRKRSRSKAKTSKTKAKSTSRKRKAVEEDDEDDDEDDEEEAPKRKRGKTRQSSAKTKAKSSKSKAKRQPPTPRELPAGKYSPADIAEMADVDPRAVRVFLRANEDDFPKDEESFRYAFNKRDAQRIAKRIKAKRED